MPSDAQNNNVWLDLTLGGIAGTLCRVPTHPLDTCKTVAFASDVGSSSMVSAAKTIWRREGVAGFYRGVGLTAVAACPGNALYFVAYEWMRDLVEGSTGNLPRPLLHLWSGFFAEMVSCVVWVPVDVIKERLQSQGPNIALRYRSSWDGLRVCARNEGLRGLYKGYFSTLASFGPFSAVYFTFYEIFTSLLAPVFEGNNFMLGLTAAFAANTTSAFVTNPLELVKTRLQIQRPVLGDAATGFVHTNVHGYQYTSFIGGLRDIVKVHGVLGLWRGSLARALHTGPNAALTMGTYRWLQGIYHQNPEN
eukprot:GILI01031996.1.p1 GENE.GILI01031996.1~~GILI01031996.1.p1  ORF type:complete len:306 (-),score=11.67 GILI01031996.1:74-991(-)